MIFRCSAEDKLYEYTLEDNNHHMSNGRLSNADHQEHDSLMPRSDSGGFRSHKPDSIVALKQDNFDDEPYHIKRQSMIKSQDCIRDLPDLPQDLHDPDVINGNSTYGNVQYGVNTIGKVPLETTM